MSESLPLLIDTGRGFTVKWRGRHLASPYSPRKRAIAFARSYPLEERTLYIWPRPLFGYGLDILQNRLPHNSFILCLEIEKPLSDLCSSFFVKENNLDETKVCYTQSSSLQELQRIIENRGIWNFRRCKYVSANGEKNWPDEIQSCFRFLNESINRYWKNRVTLIELGSRWISNILKNLPFLENSFTLPQLDCPVLLLGAGTSVDGNWDYIKQYRNKFFLLAVDTALPAMNARGVIPDAVVNVDGQYYNYLDFYHRDYRIPLISDISAYPAAIREGKQIFFMSLFTHSSFTEHLKSNLSIPVIPPMGSVAITALHLAKTLTRGPVILTGLDFAYPRGASHLKGSIFQQHYLCKQNRHSPDADLCVMNLKKQCFKPSKGMELFTDPLLLSYHQNLKDYLKERDFLVYQWRSKGLDSGLPHWETKKWEECDVIECIELKENDAKIPVTLIKQWKEKLEILLSSWDTYQRQNIGEELLLQQIKELDFLYLDTPYNPPIPDNRAEVMIPIIKKARKYLALINLYPSSSSVLNTDKKAD